MMRTSENLADLALALSKAQGQMESAKKDSTNPHFRSKYADLAAVVEAIKKPLASNGLSYVQGFGWDDHGAVIVHTRLLHASGQWLETELRVRPVKDDPQGVGSAVSYGRRYALQSIVGLTADDDDGNASSTSPAATPRRAEASRTQATERSEAPAAPVADAARSAAMKKLGMAFQTVASKNPKALGGLSANDKSDAARAARRSLVSQVLGETVTDYERLSVTDLHQAASGLVAMFAS